MKKENESIISIKSNKKLMLYASLAMMFMVIMYIPFNNYYGPNAFGYTGRIIFPLVTIYLVLYRLNDLAIIDKNVIIITKKIGLIYTIKVREEKIMLSSIESATRSYFDGKIVYRDMNRIQRVCFIDKIGNHDSILFELEKRKGKSFKIRDLES